MSGIILTDQQQAAVDIIVDWYRNRTGIQQVARIFGYAGTGKTTILRSVIEALGLTAFASRDPEDRPPPNSVLYAAYTGKAALVMTRKGTPASTIHSLIYRVSEATQEEIERVREQLDEARRALRATPANRLLLETQIRHLELRLADIHKPQFILNDQSLARDAALIVLDEVSMVGDEMAADLLAFGKPILVLGDPGQLPPIKGSGAFMAEEPDVMLTQIHRQAGESAIIRLATLARQGEPIAFGRHDDHVWKLSRGQVNARQMLNGGQVLCGRNATRLQLNHAMKDAAGFPERYPTGGSEKIICLKNRHDLGLINGMFVSLAEVQDEDALSFSARLTTEDGTTVPGRCRIYKGHFDDHEDPDPERSYRDWRALKSLIETVWGYAITVHKSQGSQWPNVILFDDGFGRSELDRRRWLYTAITRAERGLVIIQ